MRTDSVIRTEGINVLIQKLGEVDTERFISLLMKEPFDYTKWQAELFNDINVRELSKKAADFSNKLEK
jgi:hypothetical protein